jgi:threonine dehydrogenase-like Zn-dependent dehydrogenase
VGGIHKEVPADLYNDFQVKELTMTGCRQCDAYSATPFDRWNLPANYNSILELLRNGMLKVKPYISKTVKLEDTPAVYKDLGEGRNKEYLGVIIRYN